MNAKTHWEQVYRTKAPTKVSWYQEHPQLSLRFIQRTGVDLAGRIIDVGGGASTLVDDLLAHGYRRITVLDISPAALQVAQRRLGKRAEAVTWLEADVTRTTLPAQTYDVWHDRAVFHFLTDAEDRRRYVEAVHHALKPGGHVLIATFSLGGPTHCSGLEVVRYDSQGLHEEFGDEFTLIDSATETHHTPFATEQHFIYCYCRKQ